MKQDFNWRDYDNYNEWLHSVLETLTERIEKKDKEIERLNNDIKILLQENENKEKVILKYDNILNKLDTFLKNKIDNFDKDVKDTILHEQMAIRVIYDYLQIVKGDSSNE